MYQTIVKSLFQAIVHKALSKAITISVPFEHAHCIQQPPQNITFKFLSECSCSLSSHSPRPSIHRHHRQCWVTFGLCWLSSSSIPHLKQHSHPPFIPWLTRTHPSDISQILVGSPQTLQSWQAPGLRAAWYPSALLYIAAPATRILLKFQMSW